MQSADQLEHEVDTDKVDTGGRARYNAPLTGHEQKFSTNELIVSKTDARGIMCYVNDVFLKISGYNEDEMLGKPHNVIRHPEMPGCVFRLLWDTIRDGHEIFAYVVNRCKNGDHYWVLAHVTPTFGPKGDIIGFHSSRRVPKASALAVIQPLYRELVAVEKKVGGRSGIDASLKALTDKLNAKGMSYDQFALSL